MTARQGDRFGMPDGPRTPHAEPRIVHAELFEGFDIDGVAVLKDTDGARALMKPVDQGRARAVFLSVGEDPIAVAEAPPGDDPLNVVEALHRLEGQQVRDPWARSQPDHGGDAGVSSFGRQLKHVQCRFPVVVDVEIARSAPDRRPEDRHAKAVEGADRVQDDVAPGDRGVKRCVIGGVHRNGMSLGRNRHRERLCSLEVNVGDDDLVDEVVGGRGADGVAPHATAAPECCDLHRVTSFVGVIELVCITPRAPRWERARDRRSDARRSS